jgi:ADP-heptose:LPS heptosyltransferase
MRILVLMLLPIGDTLFATPALHALRRRYPAARITAVVYPTNRGVLANNPDIDEFLLWPTREAWPGLRAIAGLFVKLRRGRFDLSVEFSNYMWWLSKLGGAGERSEMNLPRLWWALPWAGVAWRRRHAVEHYTDVVRRLGIPVDDMRLRIEPSDRDKARAQAWLDNYGVQDDDLLVGIHPGGEGLWGRKRWGTEGFAQVADGLSRELGARIMLMGGRDDAELAADVASRSSARIINATAQTTLGETAALAARCDLFIGNDSSPLHIASASGTRVVGIYGLTDPRSYRPWVPGGREGADYAVVRSALPCACRFPLVGGITLLAWARCMTCPALKTITPEQVLEAALSLLRKQKSEVRSPQSER